MNGIVSDTSIFDEQTILLVEDNDDDVFIMQSAFRKASIPNPLKVAVDGEEALDYLKGKGRFQDRREFPIPAVILLDLNMPKKNGLEVLAWIRGHPSFRKITVHMLTASGRTGDVDRAAELGANAYLVKPSRIDELVEMIKAWHRLCRFAAFPLIE